VASALSRRPTLTTWPRRSSEPGDQPFKHPVHFLPVVRPDSDLGQILRVVVAGVEVLQARIGIEALANDAFGLGRGGGPSPCNAVHTNRHLLPERMALCHTPAIRLLAPCWQVFSPSDPQNHCPGSISPRSISCWLSQPNFTELCQWKVLMSKVLPGFVFKALAVRKDAMTAVRLLCQGQA
jgi:hypothetical protein